MAATPATYLERNGHLVYTCFVNGTLKFCIVKEGDVLGVPGNSYMFNPGLKDVTTIMGDHRTPTPKYIQQKLGKFKDPEAFRNICLNQPALLVPANQPDQLQTTEAWIAAVHRHLDTLLPNQWRRYPNNNY
ncbi:hypothetical protein BDV95DRAFT_603538 [Massariosphaeria phaeospora]|uniref:Uncharacterized protein n=1 Tax=Massariosphaeria phaeospora TaxID=100035 RepID=A0A7C8MGG2_9PLEO|nr:hypothetical protein BDV95DRAFT_603538 [Massariosphaeria phaeospora]